MKIIIKCKGLYVKTEDLGAGLGILNRIHQGGIMKHLWMPRNLVDKTIKVLDEVIKQQDDTILRLKGTAKTSEKSEAKRSPYVKFKMEEEVQKALSAPKPKRKLAKKYTHKLWTDSETEYIFSLMHLPVRELLRDSLLRERHSRNAIRARRSVIKTQAWDRVSESQRLILIKLSKKAGKLPKKTKSPEMPQPKKYIHANHPWTEEEITFLTDNQSWKLSNLAGMPILGRHSKAAIGVKLHRIKKATAEKKANESKVKTS